MSILDRIKRKYYAFNHKIRKIDIVKKNNQNIIKLKEKIENINKNIPLGTSSWENNRKEIRRAILKDNIMHNYDLFELLTEKLIPDIKPKRIYENQL